MNEHRMAVSDIGRHEAPGGTLSGGGASTRMSAVASSRSRVATASRSSRSGSPTACATPCPPMKGDAVVSFAPRRRDAQP